MNTTSTKNSWLRSQATALTATATDFLVTIGLKELSLLPLYASNLTGAFCGAVVSFLLLRNWAFNRKAAKWHGQVVRYGIASGLSLGLNTAGVLLLTALIGNQTSILGIEYFIPKIIMAILMGLTVNYWMFKHFVFRK